MTDTPAGFYIYTYINPGTNEPFYIGKGRGDRVFRHLRRPSYYKIRDSFFYRKLRKMLDEGVEPLILIIKENLTEEIAYDIESDLIRLVGTRANGTGPLCNLRIGRGSISEYTLLRGIKEGKAVEAWGEMFASIEAISRDLRCVVDASTVRERLKLGMPVEEAATTLAYCAQNKDGIKTVCWGKEFISQAAMSRDPRCAVSLLRFKKRLVAGWDTECAATIPLYQ